MCTTSGAVCGGYKRMLGRKKRQTGPAGRKKWSDGGQLVFIKYCDRGCFVNGVSNRKKIILR